MSPHYIDVDSENTKENLFVSVKTNMFFSLVFDLVSIPISLATFFHFLRVTQINIMLRILKWYNTHRHHQQKNSLRLQFQYDLFHPLVKLHYTIHPRFTIFAKIIIHFFTSVFTSSIMTNFIWMKVSNFSITIIVTMQQFFSFFFFAIVVVCITMTSIYFGFTHSLKTFIFCLCFPFIYWVCLGGCIVTQYSLFESLFRYVALKW